MNQVIKQLKSAIIAKAWLNPGTVGIIPATVTLPTDMTFNAGESYLVNGMSLRTDRNMTIPVTVKAGEKLFFYANKKRAGKVDPDYSVSVLLPTAEAEAVIENSREGSAQWKAEHPEAIAA